MYIPAVNHRIGTYGIPHRPITWVQFRPVFHYHPDMTQLSALNKKKFRLIGPNAYVIFWSLGDLIEMNKSYQVEEYAPGFLIFGSDGGGEAFAFNTTISEMQIVSVPFVGMEPSLARVMASCFDGFIETMFRS